MRGFGGSQNLAVGLEDDPDVQSERPRFEVIDVGFDALDDVLLGAGFAAKPFDLGEAGDARFDVGSHMVVVEGAGELFIVFDEVRARTDDAHLADENVPELGKFVDAEAAKPRAGGVNARVVFLGLEGRIRIADAHSAIFKNFEGLVLQAGARLFVEDGTGRLNLLNGPHNRRCDRKHQKNNGNGNREVERAFQEAIEWIFERFLAKADEAQAFVFEHGDGVVEAGFKIAEDDEFHPEAFADAGAIGKDVTEEREFDHDDFGDAPFHQRAFDIVEAAENFDAANAGGRGIVAEDSDGGVADVFLVFDPALQERNFFAGADENDAFLVGAGEGAARDEGRQITIAKCQREIREGHQAENKRARNGLLLGGDYKDKKKREGVKGLAQGVAIGVPEIGLGEGRGLGADEQAKNEHGVVYGVTLGANETAESEDALGNRQPRPKNKRQRDHLQEQGQAEDSSCAVVDHSGWTNALRPGQKLLSVPILLVTGAMLPYGPAAKRG